MTMIQQCLPAGTCRTPSGAAASHWVKAVLKGMGFGPRRKRTVVDLRELPAYLQRDIGLRDCDEPHNRHE
ncbi:hypothetical protein [Manganibacter manganicus]|uniref:hypothetical protein n=1 Tax=Manganibacter manganicus TaxID=1873176 RepID=UPI0011194524|nr:hypothetical protein [Pseudaminobacter manganicus]